MGGYLVIETQGSLEGKITQICKAYDDPEKTQEENLAKARSAWHTILSVAEESKVPYHGAVILDYKGAPVLYDHCEHLPKPEPEIVSENNEGTL